MKTLFYLLIPFLFSSSFAQTWYIPANYKNVTNVNQIRLTKIGDFGLLRKARPGVPKHYHTGIDIQRPDTNYVNEPIFPACSGEIISIIDNGPYSQMIIEHKLETDTLWTVYEHFHVLKKEIGLKVTPVDTIGYYFNKTELNKHGWQFDHFHFEVNKIKPMPINPTKENPKRYFKSYCLICYNEKQLNERLFNPLVFLKDKITVR
jgi:murein DD-endopeptidase MepM/ murein hydrolase activator NlpD